MFFASFREIRVILLFTITNLWVHTSPILKTYSSETEYIVVTENTIYIISSNTNDHKLITESSDFYSLSSVRDLLFHIQEHRFTIPQINNYLNKLNLKFCGFENRELLKFFIEKNSKINDLYNLDLWNEFEINNPRIFAGMYQFWCKKKWF